MEIIIDIGKGLLGLIYCFHKLAKVHPKKITIVSRQGNSPSVDIELLAAELRKQCPDAEIEVLCRTLDSKVSYLGHMAGKQMHAIATSKVLVLDSYCIAASILHHRKSLKIIQMWHAMGGYKKFGKSILDMEEGSSARLADAMDMHRNYDLILASSEESAKFFGEAFGYDRSYFKILPLPRTDLLRDRRYMEKKKAEILKAYPELAGRKIILYAPTFRKAAAGGMTMREAAADLAEEAARAGYTAVMAPHPLMTGHDIADDAVVCSEFTSMELLSCADCFVTDYSAMIYEAAIAGVPVYMYAFDKSSYGSKRGFYIDPEKDLPWEMHDTAEKVITAVENAECDMEAQQRFADKYVDARSGCTAELAETILSMI
ncbi:MAG: CDP-glycerol glycerophosphotransferase family protein [Eubacteriaceae bacterium]|jgi:CDP-ribitol ribitolphosphotransferase|nr:CDP-glycerol glycerophosphotransferase family protein [Eubacteriaceae bacterium]